MATNDAFDLEGVHKDDNSRVAMLGIAKKGTLVVEV